MPAYFGKHGRGLDLSRHDMRIFAEIVEEPVFRSGAYTTAYLDDARDRLRSLAPEVAV